MKNSPSLSDELNSQLETRLVAAAHEKRITCAGAFAIAKSLGIPTAEVGRMANELKIKISNCQLGCF
jgi:hypothetical protein